MTNDEQAEFKKLMKDLGFTVITDEDLFAEAEAAPETGSPTPNAKDCPAVSHGPMFRHTRRGTSYIVLSISTLTTDVGDSILITYVSTTCGGMWSRPGKEFFDGRFHPLNKSADALCIWYAQKEDNS